MHRRVTASALTLALGVATISALPASAATSDLIFSEYVEGSGYNKAVEIYNGTGADVDLSDYSIEAYHNGRVLGDGPSYTTELDGTLAAGDVLVVVTADSRAVDALTDLADVFATGIQFNGDDALILRNGAAVADSFGQVGVDPGSQWPGGSQNDTLVRQATVCAGDTDPLDAFDASVEWDVLPEDTFEGLGSHTATCDGGPVEDAAPAVSSISPADGAVAVPEDATITVTFSEPVDLAADAIALECSEAGTVDAALSGGPTSYVVTPPTPFAGGDECTVTVTASAVTDVDTDDPPDAMAADLTSSFTVYEEISEPIGVIQGSGAASPYVGQTVTVAGIVVGDYEGPAPTLRGFAIQSADGETDGDPATSDAIFVFNGSNDSVELGDRVVVTAEVEERFGQTQLGYPDQLQVVSSGESVAPTPVELPLPSQDSLERYESMLVTFPQELFVTEFYELARFGEISLSVDGKLDQPTAVAEPGSEANALQAANDLARIQLDDASFEQNPDPIIYGGGSDPLTAANPLRGGDSITGMTGVMTYTWDGEYSNSTMWRVRPASPDVHPGEFVSNNPRPTEAPDVGGSLKVASFNVLNYFLSIQYTDDVCGPVGYEQDCRGADAPFEDQGLPVDIEVTRQTDKLVAALLELDADVIGIMEMENTPGVEPLGRLAEELNAAEGTDTWTYVDTGVVGTDVIRVGVLYDSAAVTEVGDIATLDSSVDPRFDDDRNRPSVAQSFEEVGSGETFTVVVNHWKSKGCSGSTGADADQGDGAGCWNETRAAGAEALVDWIGTYPTGVEDDDVMIIGDLNSYAQEDPIDVLRDAGYVDMAEDYSYVFDGQWGSLDYVFASSSMAAQVTDSAHVHINADEVSALDYNIDYKSVGQLEYLYAPDMYRTSDHDPVLVGLDLYTPPPPCSVEYTVHGEWPGGFISQIWITNTTDRPIWGWELGWDFAGDEKVSSLWGGRYSQDGASVTVDNRLWNGLIWPGRSVTVGFLGSTAEGAIPIDEFTVNGAACAVG
ncbi:ExeM/NucH family extracellular endonuclease [uncultured Demequina sp.]|uniref:ExeM/NucH family extracellular endonuclease n=1 Tax=uncultured Demequina sp. TaxID=693499 RepID=UPI0025E00A6B|nr:ExeM/NucH family extracellular endonuclease [uncultured Demequina sp.]